jgi:hypothetical protein
MLHLLLVHMEWSILLGSINGWKYCHLFSLLNDHHYHQHYYYHHRKNSPFWAIAFLRIFCQIAFSFHFFGFRNNNVFTEQGRQPCVQPPAWRIKSLYLCPPVTVAQLYSQTPGSLLVAFYNLQGYNGGIITNLHTGWKLLLVCIFYALFYNNVNDIDRKQL